MMLFTCIPVTFAQDNVKVGYVDIPGFFTTLPNNSHEGYAYCYMETLAGYAGWSYTFVPGTWDEGIQRLNSGEIDIFIAAPGDANDIPNTRASKISIGHFLTSNSANNNDVLPISDIMPVYLLTHKDNNYIYERMRVAMNTLDIFDDKLRTRLSREFYQNTIGYLGLTDEERAYLAEKKELIILATDNQKPYSYFENGVHKGVIAKVLERISTEWKINLIVKPINKGNFTNLGDFLNDQEADIIADVYWDIPYALQNNLRLTTPYLSLEYVPVTRISDNRLFKPIVACLNGSFYTSKYVEKMYASDSCMYYKNQDECLDAVNSNKADITYMNSITAMYNIWYGNYIDLQTDRKVAFSHGVAAAIGNKADLRLLSILNKSIHNLNQDQINNLVNSEIMLSSQANILFSTLYRYPRQALLTIIGFFIVVLSVLLYILYSKQKHSKQVFDLAYNDYMTGLHNYRWFEENAPEKIYHYIVQNNKLAIVQLSATNWNFIKDMHNQDKLAEALRVYGNYLLSRLWVIDLCFDSVSGKIIMLTKNNTTTNVFDNIQNILNEIEDYLYKKTDFQVNIKAGICPIKAPDISIGQLVSYANIAYNEIAHTKNQIKVFDLNMETQLVLKQNIEECMEQALLDEEFQLWLQPKYEIANHKCIGAESLVRWTSSKLGKLFPDQFIPIFEKTGFILQLDFYMLKKTCAWLRKRIDEGNSVVAISVNQSRLHMTEEYYIEKIEKIMQEYNIPPCLIELELTETAFDMDNPVQQKHTLDIIYKLHSLGFKVSMDDFGSGYSSLMLLNLLPLDVMKLDKTMLNESQDSSRMNTILKNSIRMGQELNMHVICEGIETEEQEELLLSNGCLYGQGYFYARPMPSKDFNEFLDKHS